MPETRPLKTRKSAAAFEESRQYFPGGVNSPVRNFAMVGGIPLFIGSAKGALIRDIDGNEFIDYVGSWGPMILGHAHPAVVKAVQQAASKGTSYGAPTLAETKLAGAVQARFPSIERMRFVSSGTEATMSALRLARGATGRPKIIKFEGCYHGHGDSLLVKAGSGALTHGAPDSAGVPAEIAEHTLVARYNNLDSVKTLLDANREMVACVIVEPVAGNMGCVPPEKGFLKGLRQLCTKHGALLIFDEVMTGFRVHPGGAQALYKIKPDLTCLGKIVGGGMPLGLYGGRADIMAHVSPDGLVYQGGTLSGNPVAVAAGLATLKGLTNAAHEKLAANGDFLLDSLREVIRETGVPATINRVGAMFTIFFTNRKVQSYADVAGADHERFGAFFRGMLAEGVYLAPSPFEACFLSTAHSKSQLQKTIRAARKVLKALA